MTQDKREKIGVRTNSSSAKSKTYDQRAKKKLSATLLSLLDTEDELCNTQWDAVPIDVREWLAVTFTRKKDIYKAEAAESIPTIAYAFQTGVLVERKFHTATSPIGFPYPSEVIEMFKEVDKWGFDVFALNEASQGHSLKFLMCELFSKYNLLSQFKIPTACLISFASALEVGYNKYQNPYHNLVHATDVTQTVHAILLHTGIMHTFTDLEVLAIIFSTSIHDYEHTGTTNHFHVETRSETAMLYNDKSVLENHHVSAVYHLMQSEEMNILANLTSDEWRELRRLVIEMVLSTDMSQHFQQMNTMKHVLQHQREMERIHRDKIMSMIVHAADISHPAKPWQLHKKWAEALMEEFFQQGDKEAALGLPVSSLCDRKTTNIAESQIGFIDVIVKPLFALLLEAVEEMVAPLIKETSKSKRASSSKDICRGQSTSAGRSEDEETASHETGICTERQLLSALDIPRFKKHLLSIIQENREKWREIQAQMQKEHLRRLDTLFIEQETKGGNKGTKEGMRSTSPDLLDFSSPNYSIIELEETTRTIQPNPLPCRNTQSNRSHQKRIQRNARLSTTTTTKSLVTESKKVKDQGIKGNAEGGKPQKASKGKHCPSKSKSYCITPDSPTVCHCQLCDSKAFEPIDVNFIVYNADATELSQSQLDADVMDVTESYEELVDNQSSWRKAAGQNVNANIQEMRSMVPETKALCPNESDDIVIEEFIPDDPQPQMTSVPDLTVQNDVHQPPKVGFLTTDLTQSDMEIFSLWNEEVMRREAEQKKQDQSRMPADAKLKVAATGQQTEISTGSEEMSSGSDDNFVLQIISFDSAPVTCSREAGPKHDPGRQEGITTAPMKDNITPSNAYQQHETISHGAAAVSVTSLSYGYGVFEMPQ